MNKLSTLFCTTLLASGLVGIASRATAQEATYDRVVLIEEFMSATCVPCVEVTPIMNEAVEAGKGKAVSIRYHVNQPQPYDPWYKANPADVEARRTYYSPNDPLEPPHARIDGALSSKDYIIPDAAERRTVKAPIGIEVTQTPYGSNEYNVSVKVTAGPDGLDGDYRLRIVAVEGLVVRDDWKGGKPFPGYNGEVEFHDIMRKMVNSPDGEAITLKPNETKTFTASYTRGADWQANQMYTVAFVQNDDDLAVIQTGFSPKSASGVEHVSVRGFSLGSVAPNPAANAVAIGYTLGATADVAIELRNALGEHVARVEAGTQEAGTYHKGIDLTNIPAGSYILTLRAGDYVASEQVVVVK
ncbi:MAG: Omp28-related outer membrane protein [Candidatus Kapabacteria bacterium]|nr:Omp28-related outer membrane protein [Candidatus Kapabacteria bacterium]